MLVVLGAGAVILPIVLYPVSYTMWQALDIAMRPVTVDDFDLLEPSDESSSRLTRARRRVFGLRDACTNGCSSTTLLSFADPARSTALSHPLRTVRSIEFRNIDRQVLRVSPSKVRQPQ